MAWQQTEPIMNQKIQFAFRAKSSANFSELCREYGISTKTGYKWKARFETNGPEGLKEESRRPKSSPEALSEEVVCRLVRIKESHRHWGARKLQIVYERSWGKTPSESSIKRVLERCGLVEKRRKQRAATSSGRLTSDVKVSAPNDLWTVDFKGWWREGSGRSNPLTVRDAHSRYILELRHLDKGDTASVRACFERLFERHGLPKVIRSDNGPPFASSQALLGLSALSAWWITLGIGLDRSRPGCPQDNGAHERMHLDLKREVQAVATERVERSAAERQAHFETWRHEFNHERPHESLGMKCPAQVYENSPRSYKADEQIILGYEGMEVRKVQRMGYIKYNKERYQLSTALRGWDVGLKAAGQEQVEVYFGSLCIGHLDLLSRAFKAVLETEKPGKEGMKATTGRVGAGEPRRSASPHSEARQHQHDPNPKAA
jgi:transposase InsO family protein